YKKTEVIAPASISTASYQNGPTRIPIYADGTFPYARLYLLMSIQRIIRFP
ncbi:hypothetical protein AVEN_161218-1, partial [Araneus ventricosus]